jgi:hypothetical protein
MDFHILRCFRSKSTLSYNGFFLLFIICIITSLSFVTSSAYGMCTGNTCISFDSGPHLDDHGALITVIDSNAQTSTITVQVSEATTGNSIPVTLAVSVNDPTTFSGYVYFLNNDNPNPILQPFLTIPTPIQGGTPVSITATYQSLSETTLITTANFDNVMQAPNNWPHWTTPQTKQLASPTGKNKCVGITDNDGICESWKNSANDPNPGLMIPWLGNISPPRYYYYKCDPLNPPFPGTLVGNSNTDPQCPTKGQNDVYVEVDYLTGQKPDVNILNNVILAFVRSGVTLHIQLDEEIQMHWHAIQAPSNGGSGLTEFDLIKKNFFGNATGRAVTTSLAYNPELTAKKQVFHYALFMNAQKDASGNANAKSGYSELPGNDMSISLGTFTGGVGSPDELAGTLMHELGHNLYLDHGGADSYNCKPNYNSVMNYEYQDTSVVPDRTLDYSHGAFSQSSLTASSLNEAAGLSPTAQAFPSIGYGYVGIDGQNHIQIVLSTSAIVEWDHPDYTVPDVTDPDDGRTLVSATIDDMHSKRITGDCTGSGVTMSDSNDWTTNMKYNFKIYSSFTDTNRISVGNPANNMFVNVESIFPSSSWVPAYLQSHWHNSTVNHGMLPYKIPNEMTLYNVIEDHSNIIMSAAHLVNETKMEAFNNNSAKDMITKDLLMANSTVYDYAKTIGHLKDAEKVIHSSMTDKSAMDKILSLVDPALKTNELANIAYSASSLNSTLMTPVSNAGLDQNITGGHVVKLDGSSSTGIGPLNFVWNQVSGEPVILLNSTTMQPTFVAPTLGNYAIKSLAFQLTVTNVHGSSASSLVHIFVTH